MKRLNWLFRTILTGGILLSAGACGASTRSVSPTDASSPLKLVRSIPLPDVKGRIDHLAIDLVHHLLFVAEYANGSVDVIDLGSGRVVDRIAGLKEPQGVGVTLDSRQLVVASGDGAVGFYDTQSRRPLGRIVLGDDADNVRIDPRQGNVVVGYGDGALAIIDPVSRKPIGRITLPAHPEGFRLNRARAIVNVPDRGAILAVDLDRLAVVAAWKTGGRHLNFPVALDPAGKWFATAYRLPAVLELRNQSDGAIIGDRRACGDADDLFVDGDRLYLICGAGHVYVTSLSNRAAEPVSVSTAPGARTGLFVPERRELFVAEPARDSNAAILVLAPVSR